MSRRDAIYAGLALLGGGAVASALPGLTRPSPPPDATHEPDTIGSLLRLPDQDLLCRAESAVDLVEVTPWNRNARPLLLRLLYAGLETDSIRNDIIAARCLHLLAALGRIDTDVALLVESSPNASIARATLNRLRGCDLVDGRHRKGADHDG